MSLRIAIIGGGPGGLYFAALAKQLDPGREIVVFERNAADTTFGFGVVFSDETLDGITSADPQIFAQMEDGFARWSDLDVRYRGETLTSGGHGFAAIERRVLLNILQDRCAAVGVDVRYRTVAPSADQLAATYDLVVGADGINSVTRNAHPEVYGPSLDQRHCRYMWLATDKVFDAFTFIVAETEFGPMQVHAYPFSDQRSTFIIEMNESTWRAAGFDQRDVPVGESDTESIEVCERLFADHLDGHRLLSNNSRWIRFSTVRNQTWRNGNVVLLGDAAHTAHFSIGSGTKLAMEDSLALAASLEVDAADVPEALRRYESERRPVVESTQRAAQASLEWFESIAHSIGQEAPQFGFNLLTRSRRVTYENLAERDPEYLNGLNRWFHEHCASAAQPQPPRPMFEQFQLRELTLKNRIVAAPVAIYSAEKGVVAEAELVRMASLALGGAGLVMTGMTAVTPTGRVTPACAGLYNAEQVSAFRRITDLIHETSSAAVGVQLNHAGRKGATAVPRAGSIGEPLGAEGWETVAPSPIAYGALPAPRALDTDEMSAIIADFAAAARAAHEAGFDVVELQAGHGFLLSTFLSPLTNHRTDEYGGSLHNRLRFPLEVIDAVRSAWPVGKPLIVRISATDWFEGGTTLDDAVAIARGFAEHGADAIDVSSGEVVAEEAPEYGRGYQTPFAERIRNDVAIPTIAVGSISTADDANTILLAGRADLIAIGRAHLHDPAWTLHAAAEIGYRGPGAHWPSLYAAGSAKPPAGGRARPQLTLRPEDVPEIHQRWQPVLVRNTVEVAS
ncbi:bifunctional salicylyl-CoA 5-hydroxylase/oxidoreductase [Hoyosella sp. YIM 151337]|uniref:bifunctional salicylyl-CoA 5-hydroxylase/oxidoreductase n=1 Tax=Hoyosella sp. YIM 151337 TaxID=2992742 RepID=UPI0022362861|nr:bifunctional salicylyl-CoA 5-hydroxylase/oxidoreductase [Hoyosella sp. YIM 151337]MCW4354660.1 bifunctional salicylyl-CoA 5-hydroxylase/oxidoreductase [Hoyosella sp. YIM 151337]